MKLRKIFKISGIVLLIVAVAGVCFHFWFINRSVKLLENFVTAQSGGKYRLTIRKLRYNYAKLIFQLDQPTLTCLDTTTLQNKYEASAQRITINLKQLLPLLLRKELRFDSVSIEAPQISIFHQKFKDTTEPDKELNISKDMLTAYTSLRNVLGQLQVDKFSIIKGAFSIQNARLLQQQPFKITGIDFVVKGLNIKPDEAPVYDPLAITDSIGLFIAGQKIVFPDRQKSIAFTAFHFDAALGAITLDSCRVLSSSDTTANDFDIFTEKLSLKRFRLVARNGSDYTQIDSVFFTRPRARLVLQANANKKDSAASISTTVRKVVETITGSGNINYIGINNVAFDITTLKNDRESNFSFVQDKLEIGDVLLNKDSTTPVSIGTLRFGLKQYTNYFNDSTYFIQFDSVRILNGQLALYDFQLQSTPKAPQLQRIFIPILLLNGVDWFRLIFEKRFVAKSIALYDPQITITAAGGKGGKGNALQNLKEAFAVDHVLLQNAGIKLIFSKNEYAQVKGLSLNAEPAKLLAAPAITTLMTTLQGMDAPEIVLVKDGWNAKVSGLKLTDTGGLRLPIFSITNTQKNIHAKGENLRITKLAVDEKANTITLGKISWKNLVADILLPEKNEDQTSGTKPTIVVAGIRGGPVRLHIRNATMNAAADLASLQTGRLAVHAGRLDTLKELALKGNEWSFSNEKLSTSGSSFSIAQQKQSYFSRVQIDTKQSGEVIAVTIPEITFAGDIEKVAQQQVIFDYMRISRPRIRVTITDPVTAAVTNKGAAQSFPFVQLQQVEVINPDIFYLRIKNRDTTMQVQLADASFSAGVFSSGNEFKLRQAKMEAATFRLLKGDSLQAGLNDGRLQVSAASFSLYKKAPDLWKVTNGAVSLTNAELKHMGDSGKRDTVVMPSFAVSHFSATENTVKNWRSLVFNQPDLQLQHVTIHYRSNANIFMVDDLNTRLGTNTITLASFLYHPQLDEEAYIKAHPYETDFMRVKTGLLTIQGFNRSAFINDSAILIRNIHVDDVDFRDTRDKTPPFQANIIKPLPVSMIRKIPFNTAIDSINLQNANVIYKEVSEKTGLPGTIFFTRVQSRMLNLKNRNHSVRDTFQWHSDAYMMDSMPFYLGIKTAYLDSLDKLQLIVRLRPADVTHLNPFFAPLEAIRFKSAMLDTLELIATANDYVAHGSIRFFYHNLKVEFLKKGETEKQNILKSLMTFVANKFVIKDKNTKRIETVYFERIRDRSIFNYIVKIVLSGMGTSIGSKKSKKLEKAYQAKLKELGLQPLEH